MWNTIDFSFRAEIYLTPKSSMNSFCSLCTLSSDSCCILYLRGRGEKISEYTYAHSEIGTVFHIYMHGKRSSYKKIIILVVMSESSGERPTRIV